MQNSRTTYRQITIVIVITVVVAILAAVRISRQGRDGSGLGSEYRYDLSAMAYIDPAMILYEKTGKAIPTGMTQARSLAVDPSGLLYVAGDQAIAAFQTDGRIQYRFAVASAPRCLALDGESIFIGMRDRVVITNRKGETVASGPILGGRALITAIALDDEHLYIADAGQRIVWCYDREGRLLRRIGGKDKERNIPGFVLPSPYFDLAMAPDGLLRVANSGRHQIEAYTARGDREFAWGEFGNNLEAFTGCCNPVSFAILTDGRIVTCEKGLVRVKLYDTNGELLGVVAGPEQLTNGEASICDTPAQCQRGGFDVAVDDAGRVYVLDTIKNVVRIFAEKKD